MRSVARPSAPWRRWPVDTSSEQGRAIYALLVNGSLPACTTRQFSTRTFPAVYRFPWLADTLGLLYVDSLYISSTTVLLAESAMAAAGYFF